MQAKPRHKSTNRESSREESEDIAVADRASRESFNGSDGDLDGSLDVEDDAVNGVVVVSVDSDRRFPHVSIEKV